VTTGHCRPGFGLASAELLPLMLVRSRWAYGSLLGLLVLAGFASEAVAWQTDITFFLYTARSVDTGTPLIRPLDRWTLHPGVAGIGSY
jgi:hypothetical protein